ncbi:MAG: ExbD/TolR family protein, partial [Pseudomonadota bacterium]
MAGPVAGRSRRSGGGRRTRRLMGEINVTPFVDVMLVLLIVFMVTAPLLLAGVQVDLPESSAAGMPGQEEPISVTVDATGRVYVQESEVEMERLGSLLLAISDQNPDVRIFVRGDRALSYGRIMEVIGTVNAAGFRRVALVSEPLE